MIGPRSRVTQRGVESTHGPPSGSRAKPWGKGVIPLTLSLLALAPGNGAAQHIELGEDVASFGLLDGPDEEIIGAVVSMAVNQDGAILVVDRQASRVGWIRSDGSLGDWFGGAGDGPHEFEYLGDAAVRPDGAFVLLVAGHKRLVLLSPEGDSLAFGRSVPLDFMPDAMCVLDARSAALVSVAVV